MSIASFFAPKVAAAPAPAAPNPAPASGNMQDPNNANPGGQNAGKPAEPVNPMDAHNKLWENMTKPGDNMPPTFSLPSDKLQEIAGTMNFTQNLPPELQERIANGDGKAMLEAINLVGQQTYARSLEHTSSLTNSFVNARLDFDRNTVGTQVKDEFINAELSSNPAFANPAARKHLTEIAKQMSIKYPESSPAEIAKSAMQYVQDLADSINPKKDSAAAAKAGETNWDDFFGQPS